MIRIILILWMMFIPFYTTYGNEMDGTKAMNKEDGKMAAMLKEFYTAYITATDKGTQYESDSILKKYSTAELLKEIEDMNKDDYVLNFDPFISAQDAYIKLLESLSITKDPLLKNTFVITMEDVFISGNVRKERLIKIKVAVVKDGDAYKIGDILEPDWRKYKNQL